MSNSGLVLRLIDNNIDHCIPIVTKLSTQLTHIKLKGSVEFERQRFDIASEATIISTT